MSSNTEAEYRRLVAFLDRWIDEVGEYEKHPLASLMEVVGVRARLQSCRNDCEIGRLQPLRLVLKIPHALNNKRLPSGAEAPGHWEGFGMAEAMP